jgi:spore coat protein U-like protein
VNLKEPRSRVAAALAVAAVGLLLAAPLAFADDGEGGEGDEGGEGGEGGGGISGYGDTAQIEITGSIPPMCEFTDTPNVSSLGALETNVPKNLGTLAFTCNLATSGAVSLTVTSANGALKRDGGSETVDYSIAWDIQGSVDVYQATAPWTSAFGFTLQSGPNGSNQLGAYKAKITGPTAGKSAGTYRDTLTYTISP